MAKDVNAQLDFGHYLVGVYVGIVELGGYKTINVHASNNAEAKDVQLQFTPYSEFDGKATVEDDVNVGDVVLVRVYQDVQLYEVGKAKGEPTGKMGGFIKAKAIRVSRLGAS